MGTLYNRNDKNDTGRKYSHSRTGQGTINSAQKYTSDRKRSKKTKKSMSVRKKAVLSIIIIIFITIIIMLSPIFSINEIKINAVSLYSSDEITDYLNDFSGKNGFSTLLKMTSFSDLDDIFRMRFGNKEKSMLFDYPLIKNVSLKYIPPHTLNVIVEERTPVFVTESNGMYLYVDSEGYLLGAYTQADKPEMPVIEGMTIKDYKIGTSIAGGKDKKVDEAIKICSIMKQLSMLSYIDIIDISDYNNIWMYCAPSMSIKFGNTDDVGRKLSYIKGIIDSGYDGMSEGTLDMSVGGNPVFKNSEANGSTGSTTPAPQTPGTDGTDTDNGTGTDTDNGTQPQPQPSGNN